MCDNGTVQSYIGINVAGSSGATSFGGSTTTTSLFESGCVSVSVLYITHVIHDNNYHT